MASEYSTLYQIEARLQAAVSGPLPGPDAHRLLAPRPRRGWQPGEVPERARTAAALVLLYPLDDAPHILLTVRSGRLAQHAGQVSLPGGVLEEGEGMRDAALREASEEVGIDPETVRVLGILSTLYIPVSDFALHPVGGVSDSAPAIRAAASEVGRVLQVPLSELADPRSLRRGTRWRQDRNYDVPYFELRGERVWGATAMVLAELLAVLDAGPA